MKRAITKADIPRIRAIIAQKFPVERLVSKKWTEVLEAQGSVSLSESIRGLKIVVFLCNKAETIIVDEIAYRSQEGTLRALDRVEGIKKDATELLKFLGG